MYFSLAEPERDYIYFTKAASIKSKADILLLVKSYSSSIQCRQPRTARQRCLSLFKEEPEKKRIK